MHRRERLASKGAVGLIPRRSRFEACPTTCFEPAFRAGFGVKGQRRTDVAGHQMGIKSRRRPARVEDGHASGVWQGAQAGQGHEGRTWSYAVSVAVNRRLTFYAWADTNENHPFDRVGGASTLAGLDADEIVLDQGEEGLTAVEIVAVGDGVVPTQLLLQAVRRDGGHPLPLLEPRVEAAAPQGGPRPFCAREHEGKLASQRHLPTPAP